MPPKYKRKTYTKKMVRGKPKRAAPVTLSAVTALIKKTNLKQSETKYISKNLTFAAMQHNKLFNAHIWAQPGSTSALAAMPFQGPGDDERNGDRITILGFMMRAVFDVPFDRRETRITVYFVPHNSGQGDPSDRLQLFHNITGSTVSDPIQKKRWPDIVKLGTFRLSNSDNTSSSSFTGSVGSVNTKTIHINRFIKMKKKVYFTADNSITASNLKEYGTLILAPYATRNTLETDDVTLTGEVNVTTYFKDL